MANVEIDGVDVSKMVNGLSVEKAHQYNAQTNAAGDTVVDYINMKRTVAVGFRAMGADEMSELQALLEPFTVALSYRDPATDALEEINAIAPKIETDIYTTAGDNVIYNEFTVSFEEL